MTRPITENFETWLDENDNEPWPPTYASWNRFCKDTGALATSAEALVIWTAYSADGFKVVHEDGSVHRC